MSSVVEFVWWFVRAGFAFPVSADRQNLIEFRLTEAGAAFLDEPDPALHPYVPGFVDRLRSRCPQLPDGVVALLVDAQRCMDHMLLRPGIVLMGVAYEVAIEAIADALVARGLLRPNVLEMRAASRLSAVRDVIDTVIADTDNRNAARRACLFADDLRRRRNDASHTTPTYGFEDRAEAEELYASAGRQLPNLWRLAVTP